MALFVKWCIGALKWMWQFTWNLCRLQMKNEINKHGNAWTHLEKCLQQKSVCQMHKWCINNVKIKKYFTHECLSHSILLNISDLCANENEFWYILKRINKAKCCANICQGMLKWHCRWKKRKKKKSHASDKLLVMKAIRKSETRGSSLIVNTICQLKSDSRCLKKPYHRVFY